MTNITKIIEDKAREYASVFSAPHRVPSFAGFTAGASFATSDPLILQSLLQPFAEWLQLKYIPVDELVWKEKWSQSGTIYTIAELLENYIHHLQTNKDKEDGLR